MPNFASPFGAAQRSEQAEGLNPAREAQRALETSALLKGTANTLPSVYAAEDGPKIIKEAGPAPADLELPFGEAEAAGAVWPARGLAALRHKSVPCGGLCTAGRAGR
jgi:hypothetical protein